MPIKFRCPRCQSKIRVADEHAGKRAACPTCRETISIPASSTVPEAGSKSKIPAATPTPEATPAASEPYIKLKCPGCGKSTGFPQKLAGTAQSCPACRASVMVPQKEDEEAFIVGGSAPPAKAVSTARRVVLRTGEGNALWFGIGVGVGASVVLAAALIITQFKKHDEPVVAQAPLRVAKIDPLPAPAASEKSPAPAEQAKKDSPVAATTNISIPPIPAQAETVKPDAPASAPAPAADAKEHSADPQDKPAATSPTLPTQAGDEITFARVGSKTENATPPAPVPPPSDSPLRTAQPPANRMDAGDEDDDKDPASRKKAAAKLTLDGKTPAVAANSKADKQPAAKRDAAPPVQAAQLPQKPADPPICTRCLGTGFVPVLGKPYVNVEKDHKDEAIDPKLSLPWTYCPTCQKGKDVKALLDAEKGRFERSHTNHERWVQTTHLKLQYAETHHVALHSNLPAATITRMATALEDLTNHLEQTTNTTLLTQTRPDTHELIVLQDTPDYEMVLDALVAENPGADVSLARRASGVTERRRAIMHTLHGMTTSIEDMALFTFGHLLMREATDDKAPPWLSEGFAAYCENSVLKRNLCYSFTYEVNEVRFGMNWNADIKKFGQQGKLKPWDQIFPLQMEGLKALDYLTCYSMVSFLIKADPQRFNKFILNIRDGMDSGKAIEKAYGRPVREIQVMWANWALSQ